MAAGGLDGLARIEDAPPDPAILDIVMPDLDGFEVFALAW